MVKVLFHIFHIKTLQMYYEFIKCLFLTKAAWFTLQISWGPGAFHSVMSSLCPSGLSPGTPASYHNPRHACGEKVNWWLLADLRCECKSLWLFVSICWPLEELATCPGCTLSPAQRQMGWLSSWRSICTQTTTSVWFYSHIRYSSTLFWTDSLSLWQLCKWCKNVLKYKKAICWQY